MPSKTPRGLTHIDVSEITIGGLLLGKWPIKALPPAEYFVYPYNAIVELIRKNRGEVSREQLAEKVGWTSIANAIKAYETVGDGLVNWIALLERKHEEAVVSEELRKTLKSIEDGKGYDRKRLSDVLMQHEVADSVFTSLSDVERKPTRFVPSGYSPFDDNMIGFPPDDLIIVAGPPGSGKTSLMIKFALANVVKNKGVSAIFSLEMKKPEFAARCDEIGRLSRKLEQNLIIADKVRSISEVAESCYKEKWQRQKDGKPPITMIGIDFAEVFFVMSEEDSEVSAARIYGTAHYLAQDLETPTVLVAGLNRGYMGGIPRPGHIRNTGMAEYFGWEICTIYNPNTDFSPQRIDKYGRPVEPELKPLPGIGYICCWKCRGGFRKHPKDSPGALAVPWDGQSSWGDKTLQWLKLH